jgi:hypothetical protein
LADPPDEITGAVVTGRAGRGTRGHERGPDRHGVVDRDVVRDGGADVAHDDLVAARLTHLNLARAALLDGQLRCLHPVELRGPGAALAGRHRS